ncbi:MAG: RnfABCDGE type electron transport complex subunit B [Deltaproteobacteria bacterium]|nr:RnfABCDGE type electron transport complex subunit B [Deltaproteobacteria bacterium]
MPGAIVTAVGIMGGLGLGFATVLAVAYRFLKVEEDPRVAQVESMLPSTNCGACGQPGCAAFAEALVAGRVVPSGCTVSSAAAIESIAELLGVDAGGALKRVARVHCAGGTAESRAPSTYQGHASCRSAALVSGGGKGCTWGCLGLADCAASCGFDAIVMNANGLPVIDPDKCTACGDCVDACPKDLIEIVPIDKPIFVQCAALSKGEEAMAECAVACDGCGRCAADAPTGLIEMVNNLPRVHYELDIPHTADPTLRCPTGAIRWVTGLQYNAESDSRRKHGLPR